MQALLDAIAAAPAALPPDATRLFHGRGGRHPGCEHLALDVYPPVLLLTSFQALPDEAVATLAGALAARWRRAGRAALASTSAGRPARPRRARLPAQCPNRMS